MTHWLYPANVKFYDVLGAFSHLKTYWPMNTKVCSGDLVFIYLAMPYKQIGFACKVNNTELELDEISDEIKPFMKASKEDKKPNKKFMELSETQSFKLTNESPLSLLNLQKHGLKGMLMGPRNLDNNQNLLSYIQRCIK